MASFKTPNGLKVKATLKKVPCPTMDALAFTIGEDTLPELPAGTLVLVIQPSNDRSYADLAYERILNYPDGYTSKEPVFKTDTDGNVVKVDGVPVKLADGETESYPIGVYINPDSGLNKFYLGLPKPR